MTPEESVIAREIIALTEARNALKPLDKCSSECINAIQALIARKIAKLVILRQYEFEFSDEEMTGAVE